MPDLESLVVDIQRQLTANDADQVAEYTPEDTAIKTWVKRALPRDAHYEVTVRLVGCEESQMLNQRYRGKDAPTNILSFPADILADMPEEMSLAMDIPLLGDIVICAAIVNRGAAQQGKSLAHHWAHILVHGVLHLRGYDHISTAEAQEMEALECRILATYGIDNPYYLD